MKKNTLVFFFSSIILVACSNLTKTNKEEQLLEIIDDTTCVDVIIRGNEKSLDIDLGEISGTWYCLEIKDGDTIIHKYINNVKEELITPNSYKITKDSLIVTYFSDLPMSYVIDTAWIKREEYFFPIGNKYSFKWIDKKRHLAQWVDYYGREHWNDTLSITLCIDSAYNKYPIIDYVESALETFDN